MYVIVRCLIARNKRRKSWKALACTQEHTRLTLGSWIINRTNTRTVSRFITRKCNHVDHIKEFAILTHSWLHTRVERIKSWRWSCQSLKETSNFKFIVTWTRKTSSRHRTVSSICWIRRGSDTDLKSINFYWWNWNQTIRNYRHKWML